MRRPRKLHRQWLQICGLKFSFLSLAIAIPVSLSMPGFAQVQAWPSHQDRYNFFMDILQGNDGSSLPVWSQQEPVPFHIVSLYPAGTKLGAARINVKQSSEHAMDFGRTGCGRSTPSIFRNEPDPLKARIFFFVAPNYRLVSNNPLYVEQARWFSDNGFLRPNQMDDILIRAENAGETVVTIPAVPRNGPIARLITIVVPENSRKPGAAVYEGVVRSFLPGRTSDAIAPSIFNTHSGNQNSSSMAKHASSDTIYVMDVALISYLYRRFSEDYLQYIGHSPNLRKTLERFDVAARHLTIATSIARDNCKLVY